jgi:hypothetical protein
MAHPRIERGAAIFRIVNNGMWRYQVLYRYYSPPETSVPIPYFLILLCTCRKKSAIHCVLRPRRQPVLTSADAEPTGISTACRPRSAELGLTSADAGPMSVDQGSGTESLRQSVSSSLFLWVQETYSYRWEDKK